jgi:hypothetical protein
MTGAPYENMSISVSVCPSTFAMTSSAAPIPIATRQRREVSETNLIAEQTDLPTETVGEESKIPKDLPVTVTSNPPVVAPVGGLTAVMLGKK